jgi:hypothetical protein
MRYQTMIEAGSSDTLLRITGWAANEAVHVSNGKAELYSMSSRALDHRRGV